MDTYFSLLPTGPKSFYLRPLRYVPETGKPWFVNVSVGINTLKTVLPNLSKEAGLSTKYTNHSLRATSATRMYRQDIPEKVIAETTGHQSLAGLRAYENTSLSQKRLVTKTLNEGASTNDSAWPKDNKEKDNIPEDEESRKKQVPVFSGTLQNCVFNFYLQFHTLIYYHYNYFNPNLC